MPASPKRGEVWSADLGQGTNQLVVILQNEAAEVVATTIAIPLIERSADAELATNVSIPVDEEAGIAQPCVAICPQLRVLPTKRLKLRLGQLSHERLSEIEQRVAFLLGLPS